MGKVRLLFISELKKKIDELSTEGTVFVRSAHFSSFILQVLTKSLLLIVVHTSTSLREICTFQNEGAENSV